MKLFIIYFFLGLFSVVLQSTIFPQGFAFGARIDIVTSLVIFVSLIRKSELMNLHLFLVFLLGLGLDLCSAAPFGFNAIIFTLTYIAVSKLIVGIVYQASISSMVWVFIVSMGMQGLKGLIFFIILDDSQRAMDLLSSMAPQAAFNALLSLLLFPFFRAFNRYYNDQYRVYGTLLFISTWICHYHKYF